MFLELFSAELTDLILFFHLEQRFKLKFVACVVRLCVKVLKLFCGGNKSVCLVCDVTLAFGFSEMSLFLFC